MLPAGLFRERFVIESPQEERNDLGESVQTWSTFATSFGSYEATTYTEETQRGQVGGTASATVRMRYRAGVTGAMRLRWASRNDRLLYISGVVERGNRDELELTVEERAT